MQERFNTDYEGIKSNRTVVDAEKLIADISELASDRMRQDLSHTMGKYSGKVRFVNTVPKDLIAGLNEAGYHVEYECVDSTETNELISTGAVGKWELRFTPVRAGEEPRRKCLY